MTGTDTERGEPGVPASSEGAPSAPAAKPPRAGRTAEARGVGLAPVRAAPADAGRISMLVRRPAVDEREIVVAATLDPDVGVVGDTWRDRPSTKTDDGSPDVRAQVTL